MQAAEDRPPADRNDGRPLVLVPTAWPTPSSSNAVMGVAFSADSRRLALATRKTIEVWNIRDNQRLYLITNEMSTSQRGLSYARDPGTLALINGRSGTLWKIEGAEGPMPVAGEHDAGRHSPYGIALSPDARWLATCGEDKLVKIWDTDKAQLHRTLEHSASVYQVAFFPDGQRLAAASGSWGKNMRAFTGSPGEVTVWNVEGGVAEKAFKADRFCVWSVAISGNGELIAAGTGLYQRLEESGEVLVWNTRTGERVGSFSGYPGCVFTVALSPDGKRIAAAGGAASSRKAAVIRIWDLESGRPVWTLEGHQGTIYSIAFSPDGAWLASGSIEGTARLWRAD